MNYNYKLPLFIIAVLLQLILAHCISVEYATCPGATSTALSQSVSWVADDTATSSIVYRICALHPSDLRFAESVHLSVYTVRNQYNHQKTMERSFPLCTAIQDCGDRFDSDGCISGRVDTRVPIIKGDRVRSEITLNEIGSAGITLLKLCSI